MSGPIAMLFPKEESPLDVPLYKESYKLLAKLALQRHIDLRFVLGEDKYKNEKYSSYWKYKEGKLIHYKKEFSAKFVYLQARNHGATFKNRVNSPFLEQVCVDKFKTFQFFGDYSKKTKLVTKSTRAEDFKTDLVVVKPQFGANGYKVNVIKKKDFRPENFFDEKFIVQEFIDSSRGIPGLINRKHELRLYIFNGALKAAYLRLPKKGSYLSNIAQGAVARQIDMNKIPQNVLELKNKVDSLFNDITPRIYSIDVMYEKGRPWIVELNDMPGLPQVDFQPLTDIYLGNMLNLFEDACRA